MNIGKEERTVIVAPLDLPIGQPVHPVEPSTPTPTPIRAPEKETVPA